MKLIVFLAAVSITVISAAPNPQQQQQQQSQNPLGIFTNFLGSIPTLAPIPNLFANTQQQQQPQQQQQGGAQPANNPLNGLAQALNPANALQGFQSLFQFPQQQQG